MSQGRLEGISAIDAAPAELVGSIFVPFFERSPRFAERLASARPYGSWDALWSRAREIAHAMPEDEQVELLDAHPRLGAPREAISPPSAVEQGYGRSEADGTVRAVAAETVTRLEELNDAYEARFGFRYCVFVAGRPLEVLIPDFEKALAAERGAELHRGLDAVVDIGRARLAGTTRSLPWSAA